MPVAAYLRVSSADQRTDSQRASLAGWFKKHQITPVWYADTASGADHSRPELARLLADCRSGAVSTVVCWKLDRLGRSLSHLCLILEELKTHNIPLLCPGDGIDTANKTIAAELQANVLASVAQFERGRIRERIKEGIAAARQRGQQFGRPRSAMAKRGVVLQLRRSHPAWTVRRLARESGISPSSVRRILDERT